MELNERQTLYQEIKLKLLEEFPPGTVEVKDDKKAHIPVQVYIKRLEEAAGVNWSLKMEGNPFIYEKEEQIQVKGTLTILGAEREGIGFSNFQRFADTGKIKNLKYTILAAESDAMRDACNKFLMGWRDLAPYREWASNPGVGLVEPSTSSSNSMAGSTKEVCIKCKKGLTVADLKILENHQIKMKYCRNDIPPHLLRKKG